ncbi:hypothetical protein MKX08_007949 [Trichoderma sp. CBMAI-0020]|nr:hypothetical protein MKX08_007949 [Trichoderma sp. CBMAI-0020]
MKHWTHHDQTLNHCLICVYCIGTDNFNIAVDEDACMGISDLRVRPDEGLGSQTRVYGRVAIMGSTEHGACDPLADLVSLRQEYQFIDCHRITIDPHKLLNSRSHILRQIGICQLSGGWTAIAMTHEVPHHLDSPIVYHPGDEEEAWASLVLKGKLGAAVATWLTY